jgi:hypothetical protein
VSGQRLVEAALLPIQQAGWVPGPVWTGVEKSRFPALTEFKPQTIQPVASRYTDYAIPATQLAVD